MSAKLIKQKFSWQWKAYVQLQGHHLRDTIGYHSNSMTGYTKKPLITALGAHIFVTEIIYYLNEEPLMLFTSVDSLGVDSFPSY